MAGLGTEKEEARTNLQRRLGIEAVRVFVDQILPVVEVDHVDAGLHSAALSMLLTAGTRDLSLVDCCSFEARRRRGIRTAFAYDAHFAQQGHPPRLRPRAAVQASHASAQIRRTWPMALANSAKRSPGVPHSNAR